jgi:asparagine synthase (glutamine-hydrolysing)
MCGIAGILAPDESLVRDALPRMVRALEHRGPDDSGSVVRPLGGSVLGLGHRRLAILDLSPAGHQPMLHPTTGDCLTFNGEIYNFLSLRRRLEADGVAFAGHSDTEVLLHCLARRGADCLADLQGMYAFAWLDARAGRVLLARDPLGIKPLYVARLPRATLFASEVRALLASGLLPRRVDRRGLAGLIAYGAVQEPCSIVESVEVFPPGHWETLGPDGRGSGATAFFHFPAAREDVSEDEAVAAIRTTLSDAVRDHLVSDVPVGIFLSSGLDSTVIAALAARHASRPRSFTVGFADQPNFSELELANETAALFKLDHTEIRVRDREAQELALEWLDNLDQPSMDGMNVYVVSRMVKGAGIKVALSGQGGDELFGGYPSFADVPHMHALLRRLRWLPAVLRRSLSRLVTSCHNAAFRQKMADIVASGGSLLELYLHRRRALSNEGMAALGLDARGLGLTSEFQPPQACVEEQAGTADAVWRVSQLECRFYQGNMLLRDCDAVSMAHGLEVRVPMLDQRMVALMLALPGRLRLPDSRANKHLLREAFNGVLRPQLLSQSKRGFALPIGRWMLDPLRALSEQSLTALKETGLLDPRGIDRIWSQFLCEPDSPLWSRAFTLVVLGSYIRKNRLA